MRTQIGDGPFGFEDGRIMGYRAHNNRLEVEFEFWNAKRGTSVFAGFVGLVDQSAIGSEIGCVTQSDRSDLIESLVRHNYDVAP